MEESQQGPLLQRGASPVGFFFPAKLPLSESQHQIVINCGPIIEMEPVRLFKSIYLSKQQ